MSTTPEQIDLWRSARSEQQNLEFKEAKAQFDNRKLYKYCVAIANEGGGHLLLGIEDKLPRRVVGTAAFNDPIEMATKLFTVLGFRVDIEEVRIRMDALSFSTFPAALAEPPMPSRGPI
jgi:ATP-dependent DNA helicase RecG